MIVVGAVIGSGIFVVPAAVLRQSGGHVGVALLVWLVAGILSLLGALTYGELGAMKPEAGGLYAYLRDAFGPLPAFLFGWTQFLVISSGSVATLAVAFTGYLGALVPLTPTLSRVAAVLMIVLVAAINVRGTRGSADVQNWTTGLKAGAILVMSVLRMRQLGFPTIRVDRPTVRLIADWIGIKNLPGDDIGPKQFTELARSISETDQKAAAAAFNADPRDTASPQSVARLLELIWHRRTLSPGSSELLLDIMRRSTTGTERIKGLLPPGVEVAHKTGTIGGTTNDVGIVKLPDGAGHVALVVFVKESTRDVPARERAIAQISRALYDYFLFSPATPTVSSR
jgi:hypothetical protein